MICAFMAWILNKGGTTWLVVPPVRGHRKDQLLASEVPVSKRISTQRSKA